LKQRLIGAAVLLALGVIFIPMILDGTGNPVLREIPSIPRALDAVDPHTLVIPSEPPVQAHLPVVVRKTESSADTAKSTTEPATAVAASKSEASPETPRKSPVAKKPPAKKKPVKKPVKQSREPVAIAASPEIIRAWTVQVGSFNTSEKALKLRSSLRAKGFKAYVDKIRKQKKIYYRVRVGPVLIRKDADKSLKKLKKAGQASAYVVRHP